MIILSNFPIFKIVVFINLQYCQQNIWKTGSYVRLGWTSNSIHSLHFTFARSGLMDVLKCCSLIVFLQIYGNVNLANGEGLDVSSEGELVEKLLSNYHKHGRPVIDVIVVSK